MLIKFIEISEITVDAPVSVDKEHWFDALDDYCAMQGDKYWERANVIRRELVSIEDASCTTLNPPTK